MNIKQVSVLCITGLFDQSLPAGWLSCIMLLLYKHSLLYAVRLGMLCYYCAAVLTGSCSSHLPVRTSF